MEEEKEMSGNNFDLLLQKLLLSTESLSMAGSGLELNATQGETIQTIIAKLKDVGTTTIPPVPARTSAEAEAMSMYESLVRSVPISVETIGMKAAQGHALFIPAGVKLSPTKFQEIVTKEWKLKKPNLLIDADTGSAHPRCLATPKLAALPEFKGWIESVQHHMDFSKRQGFNDTRRASDFKKTETSFARHPSKDQEKAKLPVLSEQHSETGLENQPEHDSLLPSVSHIDMINSLLFMKLVNIFSAVVDAAIMSNNWIVIDRITDNSPTAELLLELAIRQTGQRPVIVVLESVARLDKYNSESAAKQQAILAKLREKATPIFGDEELDVEPFEMLVDAVSEFSNWERFDSLELPCKPHANHVNENGQVSSKRKWVYHYEQTFFASGTHYIFFKNPEDSRSLPLDSLAATGMICGHGGSQAYPRIRHLIQSGKPTVMLYNTGGVTQAYSSAQQAIASAGINMIDDYSILNKVEIVSTENWAKGFGMKEVWEMLNVHRRAPTLFQKSIVSVNVVHDSAEDVLKAVTGCFANADSGGIPELGLGAAEENVILNAWGRHLVILDSADRSKRRATVLAISLMWINLSTSFLSVFTSVFGDETEDDDISTYLTYSLVLLPLIASLIVSLQSSLRFSHKWEACEMAAALIVSEIYKFRCRVAEYDPDRHNDGGNVSPQLTQHHIREQFVHRISVVFSKVMNSDVGASGYISYGDMNAKVEDKEYMLKKIDNHMQGRLYESLSKKERKAHIEASEKSATTHNALQQDPLMNVEIIEIDGNTKEFKGKSERVDLDDYISPMQVESYYEYRAKPMMKVFEKLSPVLSARKSFFTVIIGLLTATGAVLGTFNQASWVVFSVALGSTTTLYYNYLRIADRLPAVSMNLRDLENMSTWWSACSVIDRRTHDAKTRVVMSVEGAYIREMAARIEDAANAEVEEGPTEKKSAASSESGKDGNAEKEGKK